MIPLSSLKTIACFSAASLLFSPLAHSQEITVIDDTSGSTLSDGQAGVIDFGCTQVGTPVTRTFTVGNDAAATENLVLPVDGLTLPMGYSLVGGWPSALVTPRVLVRVDKDDSGTAIEPRMFGVFIEDMPSILSVTQVRLTIPTDPQGRNPPDSQLPYFDAEASAEVSTDLSIVADDLNNFNPDPAPKDVRGIDPDTEIAFTFEDQIFTTGPKANRHRTMLADFPIGAFSGTLDDPANNDFFRYGALVAGLDPPALAPPAGDNGDGDNYGIAGIEVGITFYNSDTGMSFTVDTVFVDDGVDNDFSQVVVEGPPVLVPIPVILAPGQTWMDLFGFPLTVQLDAITEGLKFGDWSMANTDADQNPFDFPITGLVDSTDPTINGLPTDLEFPSVGVTCEALVDWPAPTVADNLDPAPTIMQTSGPSPGTLVGVGVHTVEYLAEDCAGNQAVGSFTVTVADRIAPTLVGSLPKQIIRSTAPGESGVIVNYPALTAIDDCDPNPTVTCTPASGTMFPLGLTIVCCTAEDSSGNVSDEACFPVIVIEGQPSPAPRVFEEISKRDGPAPGVPGATMNHVLHAFINEVGGIAIHGRMDDAGTNNFGLWKNVGAGLELVAREGDFISGLGFPLNAFDEFMLNENGAVAFEATLKGAASTADRAHFNDAPGAAALAINEGGFVPPLGTEVVKIVQEEAFDGLGNSYSPANLLIGEAGVTTGNDSGIWRKPNGAPLEEFAREGSPASALPGANYGSIPARVVVNEAGQVAFSSFLETGSGGVTTINNAAVFAGAPGALSVVSREGDIAPGPAAQSALFKSYLTESINSSGRVAFEANLSTGSGAAVNSGNNTGLYTNSNGIVELVAREGDVAPCLAGTQGNFSTFRDIFIADNGDVFFHVFLEGGSIDSATDGSFWRWQASDSTLHPIVREGDEAPSTQNAVFAQLTDFAVSNSGIHAITATLVVGLGDCIASNDAGLWIDDGTNGLPILKVRQGDTSDIGLGNETDPNITLVTFSKTTNSAGGNGGHGKVLNDAGEIIVRMSFNQNTTGTFVLDASGS